MISERSSPARVRSEQRHALRYHVSNEVRAYSAWWRQRLDEAGIGSRGPRKPSDLDRLPLIRLQDADPTGLVLRPDRRSVTSYGRPSLAWRLRAVRLVGGADRFLRSEIEPDFKPIHWLAAAGLPLGCSETDLERMAELGQRWLEAVGVKSDDAIVSVLPSVPSLAFWELTLGARLAGIPLAAFGPGVPVAVIERLGPTLLAGRASDLIEILEQWRPDPRDALATIVVLGGPRADTQSRQRLEQLAPGADVVEAWSPPGTRSLWYQCRRGTGLHTEPTVEYLEAVDRTGRTVLPGEEGELVWTSIGWRGSVFLRLATGVRGRITPPEPCPTCGRTSPRVVMDAPEASLTAPEPRPPDPEASLTSVLEPRPPDPEASLTSVLDGHPGVAAWQVERRRNGSIAGSLVVYFAALPDADLADILSTVDADLSASQYVVLPDAEVRARLRRFGGAPIVDIEPRRLHGAAG